MRGEKVSYMYQKPHLIHEAGVSIKRHLGTPANPRVYYIADGFCGSNPPNSVGWFRQWESRRDQVGRLVRMATSVAVNRCGGIEASG